MISEVRNKAEKFFDSQTVRKERGELIKNLRMSCGLSMSQLAQQAQIGKTTVSDAEHGRISRETEDKILKVISNHIDLAYVAGLIDRHSCITIMQAKPTSYNTRTHTGYWPKLFFHSKHRTLVDLLIHVFGVGTNCPVKNYNPNGTRPNTWQYYATLRELDIVFEKLAPYLRIKKGLVDKIIELRALQNSPTGGRRVTKENEAQYSKECEKIYNEFKKLKKLV